MSNTIKQARGKAYQDRHWHGRCKAYKAGKQEELKRKYGEPKKHRLDGWEGY